jgi:hypothetical protein
MELLNEIEMKQEIKLKELKASNEVVSRSIETAVAGMRDDIKKDVTDVYAKIQNDTSNSLKKYKESLKGIEKKASGFWIFNDIKQALFWSMCSAVIVMTTDNVFDGFGIEGDIFWQVMYIATVVVPFGIYAIRILFKGKGWK